MRTSSLKMPNLATVLFVLVIAHLALISVQCRSRRSPKFGGRISDPINSPPNLEIAPRDTLPTRIEYRIGDPNNLLTAPRELLSKKENVEASEDRLGGLVPDSYRIIPRKPEPPRIEMQLMKGHVEQTGANWIASVEYRFSDNDEDDRSKSNDRNSDTSYTNNGERYQEQSSTRTPKMGLGSRTIFEIPRRQCPEGYQLDYRKQCRKAVEFWYGD